MQCKEVDWLLRFPGHELTAAVHRGGRALLWGVPWQGTPTACEPQPTTAACSPSLL